MLFRMAAAAEEQTEQRKAEVEKNHWNWSSRYRFRMDEVPTCDGVSVRGWDDDSVDGWVELLFSPDPDREELVRFFINQKTYEVRARCGREWHKLTKETPGFSFPQLPDDDKTISCLLYNCEWTDILHFECTMLFRYRCSYKVDGVDGYLGFNFFGF